MAKDLRLENVADPKGRRDEQVARSEAKCQISIDKQDGMPTAIQVSDTRAKRSALQVIISIIIAFRDGRH